MIVLLDTMGQRYGLLPSQVYNKASTLDLYVIEKAMAFHNRKSDTKTPPKMSQTQMRAMIEDAKKKGPK